MFTNGEPGITELESYTYRTPLELDFEWDDCGFEAPDTLCTEFVEQELGNPNTRINVNTEDTEINEPIWGYCYPVPTGPALYERPSTPFAELLLNLYKG